MSIEYINRIANAMYLDGTGSGGTEVTSGGYKYHTFTSSGTFTVTQAGKFEVLVVGGGAGGGAGGGLGLYGGGGAGSGGLVLAESFYLAAGSHTVTIGSGGNGQVLASNNLPGADGNDSSLVFSGTTLLKALGGGGGGVGGYGNVANVYPAGDRATGGGTSYNNAYSTIPPKGTNGLQGYGGGKFSAQAGGGGGAGAAGSDGTPSAGPGGAGINLSTWATATSTGDSGYYAGGGGGGLYGTGATGALGGDGGGGNGATTTAGVTAQNGTANTGGGGGGGAAQSANYPGGNGGSGIVIIRYAV